MTRAGVRDEGRGAPAAACKRSFAGPRAPAKAAMTGPERHREPRTERRERPHAGSAFGNGVMRSAPTARSPSTTRPTTTPSRTTTRRGATRILWRSMRNRSVNGCVPTTLERRWRTWRTQAKSSKSARACYLHRYPTRSSDLFAAMTLLRPTTLQCPPLSPRSGARHFE